MGIIRSMDSLRRRLDDLKATARPTPLAPAPSRTSVPPTLINVLGGAAASIGGASYWRVDTPFDKVGAGSRAAGSQDLSSLTYGPPRRAGATRESPAILDLRQTVLLDIETGGFAGTPVFLIGLVPLDACPLGVVQLLARDYPEEEGILRALAEAVATRDTWITFNGKSFDGPFLRDRATRYGLPLTEPRLHIDLLHLARRRWRDELPDHRLATLEQHVLKRQRVGDVPSRDVPDLFHHFIRTGNAAPLRPVLEHNRIDLVSATELLAHLLQRRST